MGLEDELDSRFGGADRTPSYIEAERLVSEALSMFAEAAQILSKRGVPTEPIEVWPGQIFESGWKRMFGTYRPSKAADGWELFPGFYIDTRGGLWRGEWTHHPWEGENYPDSFDMKPVIISDWVKIFSSPDPATFDLGFGRVKKYYDDDGRPYLVLSHAVNGNFYAEYPEEIFKDVLLKRVALLLRRAQ